MAAASLNVFTFWTILALVVQSSTSTAVAEVREHDPNGCKPRLIGDGGITRMEDVFERGDLCCAAESDWQCGDAMDAAGSATICSKDGAEIPLFEFKCYPDNSEVPIPVVIAVVAMIVLMCTVFSVVRFMCYRRYYAPPLPADKALFTKGETKTLMRSNTGSDLISDLARRSARSSSSDHSKGTLPTFIQQPGGAAEKGQEVEKPQQEGKDENCV